METALQLRSTCTEWRAVRERVGLIDLSTLGKLDVQGKDAPQLLDMVYTHVFSTLKVGRIRYGVICGKTESSWMMAPLADWRKITTTSRLPRKILIC